MICIEIFLFVFTALNAKTQSAPNDKIFNAIIINFIYYRHSVLNASLNLFPPGASHPVFFTFLYTQFLCNMLTQVNYNDY